MNWLYTAYFTAGVKEVRAWTVKVGATAPRTGVIHTDFERGFIRAEVTAFDDLFNTTVNKAQKKPVVYV